MMLLGMGFILTGFTLPSEKKDPPPNIIFILSDDHSTLAVGKYGSKHIQTPHIDRLASEGVRFTNAFVVSSLCSPSRASILTSQYGAENGYLRIGNTLDTSLNTLSKILQKANYETAILGKWHLGSQPMGFDYCRVVRNQGDFFNPTFFTAENWSSKERKGEVVQGYFTDIITDKAIDWLENRKKDKPFALFVHHKAPHAPHVTPEKYEEQYTEDFPIPSNFTDAHTNRNSFLKDSASPFSKLEDANEYDIYNDEKNKKAPAHIKKGTTAYKEWAYQTLLKGYSRQIANLDENIGRLVDYIDQKGLSNNTIIVYTSDNGWFLGQHGLFNKMWMYEESLRVPLIIRYPGHIPKNKTSHQLISSLDYAPTLLAYAQTSIPSSMRGFSIKPILEGDKPQNWRTSFFYHYYDQFGVPEIEGLRTEQFKLIHHKSANKSEWEFYDLKKDPQEMNNQINNPKLEHIITDLKNKLIEEKAQLESRKK
jgi:arylsulfatase A-like enzyme